MKLPSNCRCKNFQNCSKLIIGYKIRRYLEALLKGIFSLSQICQTLNQTYSNEVLRRDFNFHLNGLDFASDSWSECLNFFTKTCSITNICFGTIYFRYFKTDFHFPNFPFVCKNLAGIVLLGC